MYHLHDITMKDSMEFSSFDFMLFPLGVGINGEILIIHNISRYCDGIYECVAFNDVPPAVNRVISVMVECEYHSLVHSVLSFQFDSHIFSRFIVKALLRVKKITSRSSL